MNNSKRPYGYLFVWSLLLTLLLYKDALTLPFFFDDLDHMPYIARTGFIEIWSSSGGFPYFRPLGATIWRLSYQILGSNHAPTLHAINLILHAVNGTLLAIWYHKISSNKPHPIWLYIIASGLIIYPFSYQAVPWIGALYHILAVTLVLTVLNCFTAHLQKITTGKENDKSVIALGLLATFLAPFAHENGVVVWPMICLILLTYGRQTTIQTKAKQAIIWLIPLLAWLAIWITTPKARVGETALNNAETIWQNGSYTMQAWGYPFTWTGGWLRDNWGTNDLWTALVLSVIPILIGLVLARRQPETWLAGGLTLGSALPAVSLLPFAYLISSPRLFMVPSVGIVLFWVIVMRQIWESANSKNIGGQLIKTAVALFLLVTFGQNLSFVDRHMQQHRLIGQSWTEAAELAQQAKQEGKTAVFINLPGSITTPQATYPLGHEGTVFMVSYIPLERILQVITADPELNYVLHRQNDIRSDQPYFYGVLGDDRGWTAVLQEYDETAVYLTQYSETEITLTAVGGTETLTADQNQWSIPALELNTHADPIYFENQELVLPLNWSVNKENGFEWTVFAHLLDESGQLVQQADGQAWGNSLAVPLWDDTPQSIQDLRRFKIRDISVGDGWSIHIGLYNSITGERAQIIQSDGSQQDHIRIEINQTNQ